MRTLPLSLALVITAVSGAVHAQYFTEVANALGDQPCGGGQGQGCYTRYLVLAHLDGDDALDLIVPNDGQPLIVYMNDGDATFTNNSAAAVGDFQGPVRVVAVADISGDGAADFYAPSSQGSPDKFFINDGNGVFGDEAAARLPNVASHAGAARFGDFDDDGDLDLLVGDSVSGGGGAIAHLYLNDGTGHFAPSAAAIPTSAQGDEPFDFDLLDMDGDFDLDVFIDMHNGKGALWRNEAGAFTDATASLPSQSGLEYGPGVCDVDGDGDLDIWQDNSGPDYTEQLMINDGAGAFTDETAMRVSGNFNADDNGVVCIDIDGDGDLDAAITALGGPERLLVNDGSGHFALQAGAFPGPGDASLWADYGDLDGDGKLDLVTGQGESGSFLDRVYVGSGMAVVDARPPTIRVAQALTDVAADAAPVVHFGVSDNAVTDTGPRLARAFVRLSAPSAQEIDADFMGGDLFRAALPAQPDMTVVSYQVCAVDRRGNEGCSTPLSYTSGVMGAGGAGGAGGGGQGGAGPGAGAGGKDGAGGDFDVDDGCGCSVVGARVEPGLYGLFLALCFLRGRASRPLAGVARRRRRPA